MADENLDGDHATLLAHLRKTSFQIGVEEGRWKVLSLAFPHLEVRVTGCGPSGAVHSISFQLECRNFPVTPPFVQHWDPETQSRPTPPDANTASPGVADALKEWSETHPTYGGIYRPWQRIAATHNNWATLRPDLAWHRQRDLTFIMEELYALVSEQASWLALRSAA